MNAVDILDGKNLTIRGFNITTESRRSTMKDNAPSADIFKEIEDAITNVLEERR